MGTKVSYAQGSGQRWAFMQRYDIPDINNPKVPYLTRLRIVQTPWFGCFLHAIHLEDNDRHLHDHPWSFVSIILRGGYDEVVAGPRRPCIQAGGEWLGFRRRNIWRFGSVHRMRRGYFHAIRSLRRVPTWSLILVGKRHADWGYWTETGWVDHETYHRKAGFDGA